MNDVIPKPCEESISKYLDKWDASEKYVCEDSALYKLFHVHCPENRDIESILLKVSVLNDFYSTRIYNSKIFPTAKHILNINNIDSRLKSGDLTLVNDIAETKFKRFYSFASKYCSHHNPDKFPIYDSYVGKMLVHYRTVDKFHKFKNKDLKSYPKFVESIEALRGFYGVKQSSIRDLDRFLWQAGKQYFTKN